MANIGEIFTGLSNPVPTILTQLESINRQLSFITKSPGEINSDSRLLTGESDDFTNPVNLQQRLVGVTAAKPNAKPFIIGFIPPDNPINYVPVKRAESELLDLPPFGSGTLNGGPVSVRSSFSIPNRGRQTKEQVTVEIDELRQKIFEQYVAQTGQTPPEPVLKFIVAHTMSENNALERTDGSYYMRPWNYNLGSSHATGKRGIYSIRMKDGSQLPFKEAQKKPFEIKRGTNGIPIIADLIEPCPEPTGGSFFESDDYDGNKIPYPTYFHAFKDLDEATAYQVSLLVKSYPGVTTAKTKEEYIDALLNTPSGFKYFEAPPDYYTKALARNIEIYEALYANKPLGGNSEAIAAQIKAYEANKKENPRGLMTYGQDSENKVDGYWGRKTIQKDEVRSKIVKDQVLALQDQVNFVRNIPPLVLLVNPSDFSRHYEHAVDNGIKARSGHIVHIWLERPISISSSGVTAGQYAVDGTGAGGLTTENRVHSLSYANLASLVGIYKNNGVIFSGDESGSTSRGIGLLSFTVYIYYDEHIYLGSFDDFSVDDNSDKPHNMAYTFKFTARYDIPLPITPTSIKETDFRISRGVSNGNASSNPNIKEGVPGIVQ